MSTSVARIIVSVADVDRSLHFYERVLGLQRTSSADGVVRLRTSSPEVEVMLHERQPSPSDTAVTLSFRVANVDDVTVHAVLDGAAVVEEPADQPWGERQSIVRDPDGHLVCLVAALP